MGLLRTAMLLAPYRDAGWANEELKSGAKWRKVVKLRNRRALCGRDLVIEYHDDIHDDFLTITRVARLC